MTITTPLEPGCFYHLYNRGNNREIIFREERNYAYFLKQWKKHISPVADTYAYCLLGNHFHVLIRVKESILAEKMSDMSRMNQAEQHLANFFNAYAKGFNKTYSRSGKLFEERFKKKKVTSNRYFTQLIYYIHSNAQRHGFIHDFREYPHSSFPSILSERPTKLFRQEVLDWFGGTDQFKAFHLDLHRKLLDLDRFIIEDDEDCTL
ncbi:MAG: transposase [Saprospiraceae bacterium]